ncbi:hypothetical protein EVG20_g862 [Dentipellis fragilis]|uniref:Sey1/RHD3-like three-helix bundle domain-containing protein n=1 Tax=Dentipellis fragilis TaxID=205917 RepID=A0A4Y9ZCD6_9AGAM|nr:hypothetical protein EVG20_g862 [Dentipellis fragilis]
MCPMALDMSGGHAPMGGASMPQMSVYGMVVIRSGQFRASLRAGSPLRHLDVSRARYECHGNGRRGNRWTRTRGRSGEYETLSYDLRHLNDILDPQDFERKSALFSLASSEVLLVNLWEHQVGLYQGANMGLLKTVFEVNLGLFGKKTPDRQVDSVLVAKVASDGVPIHFYLVLARGHYFSDKFEQEVQNLRKRFTDKSRDDYVFKPAYHKRIPADGVAFYMEGIWEQVQTNKDLDLPTQQELLAQFRCDEISAGALAEFNEQAKPQRRPVEAGRVVEGLGDMMRAWRSQALVRYDRDASRYHQGVYKRKRADLITALDTTLSPLFFGQLKNLHKATLGVFKKEVLDGLRGEGYNFADVVGKARAKCEARFTEGAKEAVVEEGEATWNWEDELVLLKEEIKSVADQLRKDETKKMKNFKEQISEPVDLHLNKASPDMWDDILRVFRDTLEKAESNYLTKAKSFDCTEEENAVALAILRKRAWLALRAKVDEQTADNIILGKLRAYFEEQFRYDEAGVPRVWKPEDDIDGAFKKAKDQTLDLIPLYSKISPKDASLAYILPPAPIDSGSAELDEEFDYAASLVIFTETKALDVATRFRRDADAYYVEAKRSTVSSIAQIPYWMYGVLVVLGWNEAMLVLFNPLYFTMLLVLLASSYVIIQLGLVGPLLQITGTIAREIRRQGETRLREHFSEPLHAQAAQARRAINGTDTDRSDEVEERRKLQPL